MTIGRVLADKRSDRGLTIVQVVAATRIRSEPLSALEPDQPGRPSALFTQRAITLGSGVTTREFTSQTSP